MNIAVAPSRLSSTSLDAGRFAVGQPVSRKEDPVLLRGEGRYTDDLNLPGQLHAVIVRSRVAHGILRGIDSAAARAMPGVEAIYTAADLIAGGIQPMQANVTGANHDGKPTPKPHQMALATDKVRYVGDPIAVVIARTQDEAKDAAEAVLADIDSLPAVTEAEDAAAPGAPLLYDDVPGNVVLDWKFGDQDAVADAMAKAAHVTKLRIRNSRIVVCAMEPRSALAEYDDERYVLRVGCQGAFGMRNGIKNVLGVHQDKVRVLTGNVGGSFGMKASVYPEYIAILFAAKALGRPVKWTDERSEGFLSDSHGRDHDHTVELALDAEGHFMAIRVTGYGNVGANLMNSTTLPPTMNVIKNMIGVYRTPLICARCAACSPTRPLSGPIAAPAGRKATTTWSVSSRRRRARCASTRWNSDAATTSRRT